MALTPRSGKWTGSPPEACGRDNAEGPVARGVSATWLGRRMQRASCLTLSYADGANHLPTQQPLTRLGPLTLHLCSQRNFSHHLPPSANPNWMSVLSALHPTLQPTVTMTGSLMLLLCPHLREYPQPLVRSSAAMAAQAGRAAASLHFLLHSATILNTDGDAHTINNPHSEDPNPIHASDNNGGCWSSPSSNPARAGSA